ncbi:MAG TPA: sugar ABC transporter substrate-binding protein [Egibacteraceae bacterium]|nr:sugar ABC transporter substrate-binding protein [Egibacteraceae bacterium]
MMIPVVVLAFAMSLLLTACGEAFEEAAPDPTVTDQQTTPAEDAPAEETPAETPATETESEESPDETAAQASCADLQFEGDSATVAYMPPATEFPYYIAIETGIEARAEELGHEVFTLAPPSDDVETQIGMLQDVLLRGVDAVILSTHDEQAAAPLVQQITDEGIAVVIVNSDIADFPTAIHAVVGYVQRAGTHKLGEYTLEQYGSDHTIGLIEGLPGYHSTERIGGFVDAIEGVEGMEVVASVPGGWNVEGGNQAATDMLQANPDITMIMTANDYMSIGANIAATSLGMEDVIILGNDGDTQGLEEIHAGEWEATVMTFPFDMGETTMQVVHDCLTGELDQFFHEIPTEVVSQDNAIEFLQQPERLYPPPSQEY